MERKRKKLMYCILPIAIVLLFLVATFSLGGFNVNTQAAFADDKFFGVIEITSDMLPENDNKITASQFSGFESVEEINAGRWVPIEKTGNSFLIYGFDANTVQIKLATGEFVGTSLNESKTNNDLRAMLNEGYKGYYTTSKDNAQSQNGTTEDVIFVRTQFADSSCFPNEFSNVQSTQLTGFSPITYEQAKQWNPKFDGNVWLIYDFDGTNPARVLFENGVYKSVDFGTITNDAIYSQIESKLYGWCYTTGVGKYVKITPDMLPESGYVSVDQFEGFMKMRYDEFRFSQIPDKTRDCYFIYKGDENKITCYVYKNGSMYSEGDDKTYLSNPGLKSRIEEGECWYYIAEVSEEEENGDLNQHDHSDGWTAWSDSTSLPINEGKYYLTVDVTVSSVRNILSNITLCLNGHGVKASGSGYAIICMQGGELNICDCGTTVHYFDVDEKGLAVNIDETEGTGRNSFVGGYLAGGHVGDDWYNSGAAIYLYNPSTVNMYGGSIIGNYSEGKMEEFLSGGMGVVFISSGCAFNMYGGSICYNVGAATGGVGVGHGNFSMSGGSIDHNVGATCGGLDIRYGNSNDILISGGRIVDNIATEQGAGGGIYGSTTNLVFSGNPIIKDNVSGGEASDIWLYVGDKITIGGPLDETARIGIKCVSMNGGVVTSGLEQNGTVNNFVCNRTGLLIKINDDGEIEFYKQSSGDTHTHNYSTEWSSDDESHWHACLNSGCDAPKKDEANHVYSETKDSAEYYTCSVCGHIDNERKTEYEEEQGEEPDYNQHDHSDGWTAWSDSTSLPNADGKYYLTVDVTVSSVRNILTNITLCLNGHGVKASGSGYAIICMQGGELNICDCGTTVHYFDVDEKGLAVNIDETEGTGRNSFVGGYLAGGHVGDDWYNSGAAIYLYNPSTVNMYGGSIIGNYSEGKMEEYLFEGKMEEFLSGGMGVVFISSGCAFNMYGGSICYNVGAATGGVGVGHGNFSMSGGSIDHNVGATCGGLDIRYGNSNDILISGGRIVDNIATEQGAGGGIYGSTTNLVFSGNPIIKDNVSGGEASDIWLYVGDKITIGGPLDETARIGIKCVSMNGGVVTSGLEQNGTVNNFVCNRTELLIKINDDGEIEFYKQSSSEEQGDEGEQGGEDAPIDLNVHDHSDGWTEWNNATSLPINEGKYYLTVDVTLGDSWEISNRVTLCLNGHGIKASGSGYALIYLSAWELNICDCGTTTHYFDVDETGLAVNVDENEGENRKSFVGGYLFGAKVSPKDWFGGGAAIYAHGNGTTVNMYGGTLIGNYVEGEIDEYDMVSGGGTLFIGADCAFNMYGGSICYNVGARIGGISLSGDFAMYGGSIDHNKGEYCGAIDLAYLSNNPVVIAGGRIVENVAIQSGCGGAFYNNTSRLVFSGNPVVTGNTAGGEASDIWLYVGDKITIGGPLDETARIGIKCVSMNGGVVTSGLEQNGTVNNFVCNRTGLLIKINDDGEIEFYKQYYHVETSFELGKFNGKITVTLTNTADESEYKAEDVDPDNVIFSNIPKGDYILTVSWVDGVRNSISMPLKVEPKTQPTNASRAQKVENGDYCDNYGPIVKNADEVAKKEGTTSGAKNKSTDAKEEKEEESENNAKNRSNDNSENNADRNIIVMTPFFGSPIILKKEERQLVEAISNGETSFNANNASDGIEINAPRNACYGGEAFVSEEEQKLLKVALANGKTAFGDKDDKKLKDEENEEE